MESIVLKVLQPLGKYERRSVASTAEVQLLKLFGFAPICKADFQKNWTIVI